MITLTTNQKDNLKKLSIFLIVIIASSIKMLIPVVTQNHSFALLIVGCFITIFLGCVEIAALTFLVTVSCVFITHVINVGNNKPTPFDRFESLCYVYLYTALLNLSLFLFCNTSFHQLFFEK